MDTTEAKAVLAEVPETEQAYRFRAALAAMIAEVERLTAPLGADEIDGAPVRRELTRLRTPSLLIGDSEKAAIAAFIESLAAQLAAKDEELAALTARALAAEAKLAEMSRELRGLFAWYDIAKEPTDEACDYLNENGWDDLAVLMGRIVALAARVRT